MARLTGLEPATPGVTGRYSNQLSYNRVRGCLIQPVPPVNTQNAKAAKKRQMSRFGIGTLRLPASSNVILTKIHPIPQNVH